MNKRFGLFLITVCCVGSYWFLYKGQSMHNNLSGHIIILNGSSASGKSSVQKALQAQSNHMYITVGIDSFFDALLPTSDLTDFEKTKTLIQYTKSGELIRSVTLQHDKDGNPLVPLTIGSAGLRVIEGMHYAIAAYAKAGNNVIVDYILYDSQWIKYLKNALQGYTVYCVGFKFPLAVVEQREKDRKTSPIGHARSHYHHVHDHMKYDIEITDNTLSPEVIAKQIIDFIDTNPNPSAFKKI